MKRSGNRKQVKSRNFCENKRVLRTPEEDLGAYLLLLLAALSHVLPHPWWNFTAVGAALLLWGARRPVRTFTVPVAVLAAADWYLTRFVYGYEFHLAAYLVTWAWYGFAIVLGRTLLRGGISGSRILLAPFLSATTFFLASNYAVWASPGSWYPHSFSGLAACYTAGLPFYRNDLLSTLLLTGVVFLVPAQIDRFRIAGRKPDTEVA